MTKIYWASFSRSIHGVEIAKTSAKHNRPHPMSHCRVLPPGEFNGMIPGQLAVYSESLMTTPVNIFT